MQNIMFLRPKDDEPIDRLINLDRLATAHCDPETGGTIVIVSGAQIKMGMKFEDFVKQVEHFIMENYRVSAETSAFWHNKRIEDTAKTMRESFNEIINKC